MAASARLYYCNEKACLLDGWTDMIIESGKCLRERPLDSEKYEEWICRCEIALKRVRIQQELFVDHVVTHAC